MTEQQWARAEGLFERGLNASVDERDLILAESLDDPEVCDTLRKLWLHAELADGFLAEPASALTTRHRSHRGRPPASVAMRNAGVNPVITGKNRSHHVSGRSTFKRLFST